MAITIMLSITVIWFAVGFWGMWLAADPNFDKVNVPALLALFVFPFIILFTGASIGMI